VKVALTAAPENAAPRQPEYTVSAVQLATPAKAHAYLRSAQQEFRKMNLDAALAKIDLALQIDPQCAPAFSMRAFIKLAMKDLNGARDDAQQAIALEPKDAEAFIAMSMAYNSLYDFANAAEAAHQALALNPDSWTARLEMAKSLYGQRQFVPALRELDSLQQDFPDVHLVRGNVLVQLGRGREAADEFSAFLAQAPNDSRAPQLRQIVARARLTSLTPSPTQP